MAGLTFAFKRSLYTGNFGELSSSWTESQAPVPYRWGNTGGDLVQSVKDKVVSVRKAWLDKGTALSNIAYNSARCFLFSMYELGYNPSGSTSGLGVGKNKDEMYLAFSSQGMTLSNNDKKNNEEIIPTIFSCSSGLWLRDRLEMTGGYFTTACFVPGYGFLNQHNNISRNMIPGFCL
ncbi:hypothetical protein [Adlercreutzia murintestinalis]|jgi:hypothetical protein|uniref:hypothetical protein n=1 Tax=Adlercreutzia murintestinalis TaxID=2941325 RepID=UPI00203D510B|nr:hypothetical protein [Adlercreutzia murintestinalis]